MNTLISALMVGMMTLGGFSLAIADDDKNRENNDAKYCHKGHGDGYKRGHHRMGKEQRIDRMARHLDLSDEQKSKVQAVFDMHRKQLDTIQSEKMNNRKLLRKNMHADKQNQAKIEKLAKQQGDLVTQKIMIKAKTKSEISKILTSDQREKMKTMRAKYGQRDGRKYCHHE